MTTEMFQTILVATDGSDMNRPAVTKALEIARACGSIVYALYVIDERSLTAQQSEVYTADVYRQMNAEAEDAAGRVRDLAGSVEVRTVILSGRPAQVITKFATDNGIDLIIVGSRGKGGLERLILGSVAESVIRMADCMVLVVKK